MGNQICCEEVNNSKEDKIIIYVGILSLRWDNLKPTPQPKPT